MDRYTSETVLSDCVVILFYFMRLILYSLTVGTIKVLRHQRDF